MPSKNISKQKFPMIEIEMWGNLRKQKSIECPEPIYYINIIFEFPPAPEGEGSIYPMMDTGLNNPEEKTLQVSHFIMSTSPRCTETKCDLRGENRGTGLLSKSP